MNATKEKVFLVIAEHPRFGKRTIGRYVSEDGAKVKADRLARFASKLDAETVYSAVPAE